MHAFSVVSDSLQPHGLQPPRLLCPWDFPGKNTGVVCHFLLQGIFLTQGSNLCLLSLLRWQVDSFTTVPSESKIYHPKICLFGMRITVDWLFFKKKKKKQMDQEELLPPFLSNCLQTGERGCVPGRELSP